MISDRVDVTWQSPHGARHRLDCVCILRELLDATDASAVKEDSTLALEARLGRRAVEVVVRLRVGPIRPSCLSMAARWFKYDALKMWAVHAHIEAALATATAFPVKPRSGPRIARTSSLASSAAPSLPKRLHQGPMPLVTLDVAGRLGSGPAAEALSQSILRGRSWSPAVRLSCGLCVLAVRPWCASGP